MSDQSSTSTSISSSASTSWLGSTFKWSPSRTMVMVSFSLIWPFKINTASLFKISLWIKWFNGLAPKSGVQPFLAKKSTAS
ncbi:hypothetical protein WICPIJ_009696 [Wickerhamomyces pijperi]|uniref:Uncharacterized protein n=1 Tax=Wickerhamomyces pijperi TaxID=599730 RepID=A0A9P8TCI4_WICPI|nr:hypothetical protein WICPIJ_009696 [Wickerhamomyces pijperi]